MTKQIFSLGVAIVLFVSVAHAQKAEVTISLNETFFDSLLDSIFQNFDPPEFPIAVNRRGAVESENGKRRTESVGLTQHYLPFSTFRSPFSTSSTSPRHGGKNPACAETVKLLREMNGVRTAVRFREGKVYVPLAFSGTYSPPFVGCVEFAGWAEANLELEFDQNGQRLIGKATVFNVNLNGTGGLGGSVMAKLIQNSIDKKLNPIEILTLDKVSFGFPVQRSGNLRMKATGMRPEISGGLLNIRIDYQFLKG